MTETLLHAYLPLIVWTGLGLVVFRFLPQTLPRFLGRALYWVGVPWEILALARQTEFSGQIGLAPLLTAIALGAGLSLAWLSLHGLKRWAIAQRITPAYGHSDPPLSRTYDSQTLTNEADLPGLPSFPKLSYATLNRAQQGSFIVASMLGNTGFVGLGLIPWLISAPYLGWAVFYSVTQNIVGTYGIGVLLSSYFGRSRQHTHWWLPFRDLLTVPSLWAFAIGFLTRSIPVPAIVDVGLQASLWVVIPAAFLLTGMRLSQLRGWNSLRIALVPTLLKVAVIPAVVGCASTLAGLSGDSRLALVLMAGMPSAFAGLILAEEYELDREIITSSIALTTLALLLTIPVWLFVFG